MADGRGGGDAGDESGPRSAPAATFESGGGRLRVTVELKPGVTTIVSWRKLLKEHASSKSNEPGSSAADTSSEPANQPPVQPPPMDASKKKPIIENEGKDSQAQAGPNRLSNVIERIERMYAGNGSSDEDDAVLDDVPDDDEYDTCDSFIDDAELDDYFQVDNSAIKHDGFFVNRGKLERIEPTNTISENQQQTKKRRRKDLAKDDDGSSDRPSLNKQMKINNKGKNVSSLTEKNSISQPNKVSKANVHGKISNYSFFPVNFPKKFSLKNKTAFSKVTVDPTGASSGNAENTDWQRTGIISSKIHSNKKKESTEFFKDAPILRTIDKSLSQSGRSLNNIGETAQSIQRKEKGERFDLNVPASRDLPQTPKVPSVQRKEGSVVRSKSSMLDKAIKELEKTVAESRPPSTEAQDADNSSQTIKRRLPPEIKQKLAKVARLTHVSYGKIPKEVINRLMSIVGHLMQLRTLKRNLKDMANMGVSAKQEKDDRAQKIKEEVADMVKIRLMYMKTEVDLSTEASDDFQEPDPEEIEAQKRKYTIDEALENKICDLYDLYIERLEEDSGPPVRRLYEELASLWPTGIMDIDRIKRAIYKAKDRRKSLISSRRKDQEKIKKKLVTPKTEDAPRAEALNVSSPLLVGATVALPAVRATTHALANTPNMEKSKHEKVKGNSSKITVGARISDLVPKKKVKRKTESIEGQPRHEKAASHAEERSKLHKQVAAPPSKSKSNPHAPAPLNSERLS